MSRKARSPSIKRIKLETSLPPSPSLLSGSNDIDTEDPEYQCSICLQDIVDRTVVPTCFHEFCFECVTMWAEQSRRCPLCSQSVGDYLLHNIRSKYDFRKHYLPPLRKSPVPERNIAFRQRQSTARERERERRLREERQASDRLAQSIEKRRWIYRHNLYAKHVASNRYTRYRPYPTPALFAASNDLITRTTIFLRRELQVWDNIDVEFLTTFTISLMKSIDIRSESAVKLLAEFLDLDGPYVEGGRYVNAEHFAHGSEIYSFVRSPFRDLFVYDSVVQYDAVNEEPPPAPLGGRWRSVRRSRSRSCSPYRNVGHGSDRSVSYSPSGRRYPSNDVRPVREFSTNGRSINALCRNHSDRRGSEQTTKTNSSSNDVRDTSGRLGDSTTRRERDREHFDRETENRVDAAEVTRLEVEPPAAERSVAHTSAQCYVPVTPPRPSAIRPGHRSLAQSVQTYLKRGSVNQRGSSQGTRPERHLDPPLSTQTDSSPAPALVARLSDSLPSTQQTKYNPELPSSDEIPLQARACTAQAAADSSTTGTSTSSFHVPDDYLHFFPSSLTPTQDSLHTVAKDFPREVMCDTRDMEIRVQNSPIRYSTRPSISTGISDDDFCSTPRKDLSPRLEREKFRAQCVIAKEFTDVPQLMDESSTKDFIHQQILAIGANQTHDEFVVDPHAMETKLRKRAQLQVRLAAEKRSTGL